MSRVVLVVAVSRNGVIGRAGGLPWHLSSDLKLFKSITMGKPVIMGRKTWESLPRKPLPGRLNIVVTRQSDFAAGGAIVVRKAEQALSAASSENAEEIAVIGGGEIYKLFMPIAARIYRTDVECDVEGDTYFSALPAADWQETSVESFPQGPKDSSSFKLRIFDRRSAELPI